LPWSTIRSFSPMASRWGRPADGRPRCRSRHAPPGTGDQVPGTRRSAEPFLLRLPRRRDLRPRALQACILRSRARVEPPDWLTGSTNCKGGAEMTVSRDEELEGLRRVGRLVAE